MDSPRTESFFFHTQTRARPSAPIDIPSQSRSVSCPTTIPSASRPLSPELIFDLEMDILAPLHAPAAATSVPPTSPIRVVPERTNPQPRPLLYPFPVLDLDHTRPGHDSITRAKATTLRLNRARSSAALPSASLPPFPIAHVAHRHLRGSSASTSSSGSDDARASPVHKIVGFAPESDKENLVGGSGSPHAQRPAALALYPDVQRGRSKTIKAGLQTPSPSPPRLVRPRLEPLSAPATLSRVTAHARRPSSAASTDSSSPGPYRRRRRRSARDDSLDVDRDSLNFAQFLRRRIEARSSLGLAAAAAGFAGAGSPKQVGVW
ncbi:hypothetical protein MKEN_01393000 [Mycena kentingensis (nom. inval.)]|nr:hypothetical protein MKEN_01393000 [Mycena kentingensis (nom. inval.)]